ncbi:MAG: S1 family peptidase [Methylobacter sp.]
MTAFKASIEHALARNTVHIAAGASQGQLTSTGTGFFYQITHPTSNLAKVVILTNKHVVRNAAVVQFVLSSAPSVADLDAQHQPKGRTDHPIFCPLAGNLIAHPDPEIDLCAIDITIPYGQILQSGRQLRSMCIDSSWLPSQQDRDGLRDIEHVLVIGYPIGLWDEHNNMPIARRGSTATHPMAHYSGKRNFLVDVAAFQGSSGSPVFSYEAPMFRQPDGSFTPGTKVNFIGVVWGVIERTVAGKLQAVEIPSALEQIPVLQASLNLAIALHSDAVRDLDEIIFPGINAAREKVVV